MNTSDVLNRLTHHRRSQAALVKHLHAEEPLLADKVEGCGTWLHIREWMQSGESRLRNANFCKRFLLCRSCAARRAGKMVAAYANKVETVQTARPDLIPAMITLTVKNGESLPERLQHLKDSWRRMMCAKRAGATVKSRNATIEWNKVHGSIKSIEVTHKNGWHPHIHAFVLLDDYVSQQHLSSEWERFTGDSMIVDVRKCRNGIVPGLIETLKYCSKLTELKPDEILHVHRSAKGSRFTDAQGIMRGVPEPEIDQDDDTGLEGPYRDFMAIWGGSSQSYFFQDLGNPNEKLGIFKPGTDGFEALPSALGHTGF